MLYWWENVWGRHILCLISNVSQQLDICDVNLEILNKHPATLNIPKNTKTTFLKCITWSGIWSCVVLRGGILNNVILWLQRLKRVKRLDYPLMYLMYLNMLEKYTQHLEHTWWLHEDVSPWLWGEAGCKLGKRSVFVRVQPFYWKVSSYFLWMKHHGILRKWKPRVCWVNPSAVIFSSLDWSWCHWLSEENQSEGLDSNFCRNKAAHSLTNVL